MFLKLAFGYKMGSGKDEAVSYLIRKYGGKKISFADPIYKIQEYAQDICGFAHEKDRKFLQWIGTEWARKKDNDVWINLAINSIPDNENVFISDLRFLNEFNALKKNGFICIKIIRNSSDGREGSGNASHTSEKELDSLPDDKWDFIIDNNSTLEEFHNKLDKITDILMSLFDIV